jgi:hypothetical protein
MSLLANQCDRAIVEGGQDYRTPRMVNYFASVSTVSLANRVDAYIKNPASKYLLRVDELRSLRIRHEAISLM